MPTLDLLDVLGKKYTGESSSDDVVEDTSLDLLTILQRKNKVVPKAIPTTEVEAPKESLLEALKKQNRVGEYAAPVSTIPTTKTTPFSDTDLLTTSPITATVPERKMIDPDEAMADVQVQLDRMNKGFFQTQEALGEATFTIAQNIASFGVALLGTTVPRLINGWMKNIASEGPLPQGLTYDKQSPTFYQDTFKAMDEVAGRISYTPRNEKAKAIVDAVNIIPHGIKAFGELVGKGGQALGISEDKAKLLAFGMELAVFYTLDVGVRQSIPHIKGRIAQYKNDLKTRPIEELANDPKVIENLQELKTATDGVPDIQARLRELQEAKDAVPPETRPTTQDMVLSETTPTPEAPPVTGPPGGGRYIPTAVEELKQLKREVLNTVNNDTRRIEKGLEGMGYTPEQVKELAPKLKEIRANKRGSQPKEEAPILEPITSFTTAQGSTYTVIEGQRTVRNKAARAEHPGEEGIQPQSEKTYYVTPEEANRLAILQTTGGHKLVLDEVSPTQVGAKYVTGPNKGKFARDSVVNYTTTPEVGRLPVEYFGPDKTVHFGNKITNLREPTVRPIEITDIPKPIVEGVEPIPTIPVETPIAKVRKTRKKKIEEPIVEEPIIEKPTKIEPEVPVELGPVVNAKGITPVPENRYYTPTSLDDMARTSREGILPESTTALQPSEAVLQVRVNKEGKPSGIVYNNEQLHLANSIDTIRERIQAAEVELPRATMKRQEILQKDITQDRLTLEKAELARAELGNTRDIIPGESLLDVENNLMRQAMETDVPFFRVERNKKGELVLKEVPKKSIESRLGLERGDSVPTDLTPIERLDYIRDKTRDTGLTLDEITKAIEEGKDISDRLPSDIAPQYRQLLEDSRQGIGSSEMRKLTDILKDIHTALGEKGAVSFTGERTLSHAQKLAIQRLENDARILGRNIEDVLREAGTPVEEILMYTKYLGTINNPLPPSAIDPRNMSLDTRALAHGDTVVKQRKTKDVTFPPLYKSGVDALQGARELSPRRFGSFLNPIRLFEEAGISDPFYYAYREVMKNYNQNLTAFRHDVKDFSRTISKQERENIVVHAYSLDKKGQAINKFNSKSPKPLTPKEEGMYNYIRDLYDTMFEEINRVRVSVGRKPMDKVPNYFTFVRTFNLLEKMGIQPNLLLDSPKLITGRLQHYSQTPFKNAEKRTRAAYTAEYDAMAILKKYGESAIKYNHITPFTAVMNEYISTGLPNAKTGKYSWRLENQKPELYKFLREWTNHIAGEAPFSVDKGLDRVVNTLSKNIGFAYLSGSLRSAAIQPSALKNTLMAVGPKHTMQGMNMTAQDILSAAKGKGMPNRDFALKTSDLLDSRKFDAVQDSLFDLVGDGKITAARDVVGQKGLKALAFLDFETALITWNGAYKMATDTLGLTGREAKRYADDILTKTQGSALPGDLARIQRSGALGKLLTQFQTFTISDWNFLTHDVLNMGKGAEVPKTRQTVGNVAKLIGLTTIFNIIYEDVFHIPSPLPTPIREIKRSVDRGDSLGQTAFAVLGELTDPIPIIGSARYGRGVGGPIIGTLGETVESFRGAPLSKPLYEPLSRVVGIPGAQQVNKTIRGLNRGENPWAALTGWYSGENTKKGTESPELKALKRELKQGLKP